MPAEPIVSRLKVNLDLKAWLKPFFIHPSVTDAAAYNLEQARIKKQDQQADEELAPRVPALFNAIFTLLPGAYEQLCTDLQSLRDNTSVGAKAKVAQAWRAVHILSDQSLIDALRDKFRLLQDAEYNLYIDIATQLAAQPSLLQQFENRISQDRSSYHLKMIDLVRRFVSSIEDEPLRNSLSGLIHAYDTKMWEKNNPDAPYEQKEKPPIALAPYVNREHVLQGSFLKTYGFDGFESTSTEIVDAQGRERSYDQKQKSYKTFPSVPFSLALMTFLGFPTRLHGGYANLGVREIVRNLFGGWDSLISDPLTEDAGSWTFRGKRLWNVLLLPIKFVIFAIKLLTIPLKFMLNVLKLFSEFLPEVILNYSGFLFGRVSSSFLILHYSNEGPGFKIVVGIITALIFIVTTPIHYAARLLALVGTALTSPEKSARMAWNYGRALNSRWGYVFAFIGAALSVTLSATLWAIALPFVFAEALVLIPALGPIVAGIAQWPIVVSTLTYINGAATLVAGTLPAAFSLAATALSSAFGVAVTATTLAVATTVAFIVAPVASIVSRILDVLSNAWTKWGADAPLLIKDEGLDMFQVSGLQSVVTAVIGNSGPSSSALRRVEGGGTLYKGAKKASARVDELAEARYYIAQTPKVLSPGINCQPPHQEQISYTALPSQ